MLTKKFYILIGLCILAMICLNFTATQAEATWDIVYYIPHTTYYTCDIPDIGVVHTKNTTKKEGYYSGTEEDHYEDPDWVIPPPSPFAWYIMRHIDHPVSESTMPPTSEYVSLDRYHWRCR